MILNQLWGFIIDICSYQVNRVQLNLKIKQRISDMIIDVKVVSVNNLEGLSQCFPMVKTQDLQTSL